MESASERPNESTALASLRELDVLDSQPEAEFDALVKAAAIVCDVPISLISLIDAERQWFKANIGLPGIAETPRDVAFCAHSVVVDGLLEVPDATLDPRFVDNPLVNSEPNIRFYAGAPLRLSDGSCVGTLCVIDHKPRQLTYTQRNVLRQLALAATNALENRRVARTAKQAQMDLADSEERFYALSDSSTLGVYHTSPQGLCLYVNKRYQEITGLTREESLGVGWRKSLHPEDGMVLVEKWRQAIAAKTALSMEFRILHRDGRVLHVHTHTRAVVDHVGKLTGYVGSIEDITQRKIQEERLRKDKDFLERAAQVAGFGAWEMDVTNHETTFSAQTNLFGMHDANQSWPLEDLLRLCPPETRKTMQAALERCIDLGESFDLELPFKRLDGANFWAHCTGSLELEHGKPVRIIGAVQDITDRVAARHELLEANSRVTLATISSGIGIWDCDLVLQELRWDEQMYRLYGLVPLDTVEETDMWLRNVHPDDRSRAELHMKEIFAGSDATFDIEYRVVWANGDVRHLRVAGQISHDQDGRPLRSVGTVWDITESVRLASELSSQHELLEVTMQSIADAVMTTDATGKVVWFNPVAEQMTGWLTADAKGHYLEEVFRIVNEETRETALNPVTTCLNLGEVTGLANHTLLIARDGREFSIEDSAAPIRNRQGETIGVVLVFHDVSEQRRLTREMNFRISHDALTGLINRAEFELRLQRVLQNAREEKSLHALLYIDLDEFKLVNDAGGHMAGDELLQQVAHVLGEIVRGRDTLARIGGDEFAVILEHCTAEQAFRIAQDICDRFDDFRFSRNNQTFRIGTSIGLVQIDAHWPNLEALHQAADSSCYAAKDAGRNCVHIWRDSDRAMLARRGEMQWTTRISKALDESRFVFFAQRITPLHGAVAGIYAEVLLRMKAEDGSLVPPGVFVSAVERFHLASRIDRWVLQNLIAWMQSLPSIDAIYRLNFNISGQSLGDGSFHRWAIKTLAASGPRVCAKLCVEITETAAVTNLKDAAWFIEQLRTVNVAVALDDFGAGASSFSYLKSLTVDCLKIDGSFVSNIVSDPIDDAAVRCFVDIANIMGITTIAEHVEKPEVQERLNAIGVDFAQGFLLHQPEPIDRLMTETHSVEG